MKIEEIRNRLVEWANRITSEYPGLKVRFEYNTTRCVYLVSLCTDVIADMESFSRDVMSFEDEMEDIYGCNAPLLCDNEELFQLSSGAETIVGFTEMSPVGEWRLQIENLFTVNPECYNLAA
ncbi:hypothetical protein [uncultured Duncaniella sp.]|uniref:hypothetical protein n=1 Tax=uncultured Duncaniella sp. TaxID=2768039 RepID=UPI00267634E5|nr:hypothetical protein [uncultured Duncaniella sp.]MCI9172686.1 hypothetical protein [Muribaculaceae bacterium]